MFELKSGEITVKCIATEERGIDELFDYLKEGYYARQQSQIIQNDKGGCHAFIVLKSRGEG